VTHEHDAPRVKFNENKFPKTGKMKRMRPGKECQRMYLQVQQIFHFYGSGIGGSAKMQITCFTAKKYTSYFQQLTIDSCGCESRVAARAGSRCRKKIPAFHFSFLARREVRAYYRLLIARFVGHRVQAPRFRFCVSRSQLATASRVAT